MDVLQNICLCSIIILSFLLGWRVFFTFHGNSQEQTKNFAFSTASTTASESVDAPDFFDSLYKNGMNKCCYEACKKEASSKGWHVEYSYIRLGLTGNLPQIDFGDPCRCKFHQRDGLNKLDGNGPAKLRYDQCMNERPCCAKACDAQYGRSVIDSTDAKYNGRDHCSCVVAGYREPSEATKKGIFDKKEIGSQEGGFTGLLVKTYYDNCFRESVLQHRKSVRPQCCAMECKNKGYKLQDADGTLNYGVDTDDNCKCRVDGTWINLGITGQYTEDYLHTCQSDTGIKRYYGEHRYRNKGKNCLGAYQSGICVAIRG